MKRLTLIRHSKAESASCLKVDRERNLTETGRNLANSMAEKLLNKQIHPDAIICSIANRTLQTARIFSSRFQISDKDFFIKKELYLADTSTYNKIIKEINNQYESVFIIGHNPGITETANKICTQVRIDHMAVCSAFSVNLNSRNWSEFEFGQSDFSLFEQQN